MSAQLDEMGFSGLTVGLVALLILSSASVFGCLKKKTISRTPKTPQTLKTIEANKPPLAHENPEPLGNSLIEAKTDKVADIELGSQHTLNVSQSVLTSEVPQKNEDHAQQHLNTNAANERTKPKKNTISETNSTQYLTSESSQSSVKKRMSTSSPMSASSHRSNIGVRIKPVVRRKKLTTPGRRHSY